MDLSAPAAANVVFWHHAHHLVDMDEEEIQGMIRAFDFIKLVAEHLLRSENHFNS